MASGAHKDKRLNAKFIPTAPPGMHLDGHGLYLRVDESGARRWILRLQIKGRRRDFGLGSFQYVSLAEARTKALAYRRIAGEGKDPLLVRKKEIEKAMSVKQVAYHIHESYIKKEGKNGKHKDQWINTLEKYVFPKIGNVNVDDVGPKHIMEILQPIWNEKRETARRVRQRLTVIFDWAISHEFRMAINPTTGIKLLGRERPSKSFKTIPHPEIVEFMHSIRTKPTVGAKALRFTVLTAMRSNPVRHATWEEFGGRWKQKPYEAEWRIPGIKMKAGLAFRVPLNEEAIDIIFSQAQEDNPSPYVFPAPSNPQKPISDATMRKLLQEHYPRGTVHGMRTIFRTWAEDHAEVKRDVKELALAHALGKRNENKVEDAYNDSEYYETRQILMIVWGRWLADPNLSYEEHREAFIGERIALAFE